MNNVTKFLLVALVTAVTLCFASGASASSRFSRSEYRSITVTFTPSADGTFGGIFKPDIPSTSTIYVPVYHSSLAMLFGGDPDHDDTTDLDDTTDVGDDDHDGDHDGDTTDVDHDGDPDGDHDHDTTDVGHDSTDDHHHDGDHNENDTIDCDPDHDPHGHHGDDTTTTHDTTDRALFGSGSQSIVIKTSQSNALVGLEFVNNLTTELGINKISFATGKDFAIVSGVPSHLTPLAPGQKIYLTIRYSPNGSSGQTDQLIISTSSCAKMNPITFTGIQNAASSVSSELPRGVLVTTAPNPMTTNLTVSLAGIAKGTVTVYDINGKTIRTADVSASSWSWDGTATDGSSMRAGTYFVNVAGTSADGTPFVSTRKIALNK